MADETYRGLLENISDYDVVAFGVATASGSNYSPMLCVFKASSADGYPALVF